MSPEQAVVIDTHNHYWQVGVDDLYWLEDPTHPVLANDYLPPDLKPHMDAVGVGQSVIVQASHAWKDQLAYLEMAELYDYVAGVIAWVDLQAPDVGDRIDELATSPWFRGIRAGAEDQADADWLARDDVRRGISTVLKRGHVVELLVKTPHLPHVLRIASENEGGRLIVDHLAKPPFETPEMAVWQERFLALAPFEHLRIKISGLLVECPTSPTTATIRASVDPVLDNFPIDRLIWGSDWPVALLAAGYEETFETVTGSLDRLSAEERAAVLGGNAREFYSLT